MATTASICKKCEVTIENEHVAGEEDPKLAEYCHRCETLKTVTNLIARTVKTLEDKLPGNPDTDLQALVQEGKANAAVVSEIDAIIDAVQAKNQPELEGMTPALLPVEIRAQELAAAQDQKEIVSERVKDRERTLLYRMKDDDTQEVVIADMTGLKRIFRIEQLEKVKTKKGGNN